MIGTPSRTPMAPTPSVSSIPHANAQQHQQYNNQYNMPRTYEVYRLMDPQTEAAIPPEVREQFARDDEGRLLWFTSAGCDRSALNGVAPEYAGLGHSVSHLAHINDIREERRRKRKERDEALAREEEARKKFAGMKEASEEQERRKEEEKNALIERALMAFTDHIARGTAELEKGLGNWREEKKAWDEERKRNDEERKRNASNARKE
jgi:chromatin structure-remodeling complex subunit RSC1/2